MAFFLVLLALTILTQCGSSDARSAGVKVASTKRQTTYRAAGGDVDRSVRTESVSVRLSPVDRLSETISSRQSADMQPMAPRIGDPCSDDSDCAALPDSSCQEGACTCNDQFVQFSRLSCLPRAAFFGDSCIITAQCVHMDLEAVCYKDACLCEPHYYIAATQCTDPSSNSDKHFGVIAHAMLPLTTPKPIICHRKQVLGEPCCVNKQCAYKVSDSECREGVCACRNGFAPIGSELCGRKATALGESCTIDAQCENIRSSVCKATGFCWCDASSTPSASPSGRQGASPTCLALRNLGESCVVDEQCTRVSSNAECVASRCACASGYVRFGLTDCLPMVDDVGGSDCESSRQCGINNTFCSPSTGKCECHTDYCEVAMPASVSATCIAKVGDGGDCRTACQCRFVGSSCTADGKCQCETGFNAHPATGECAASAATLAFATERHVFARQFCCFGEPDEQQVIGQVFLLPVSTAPTFTEDSPEVSIDADGVLTLDAGQVISVTTSFTVTAASATDDTITVETTVELQPRNSENCGETVACCMRPLSIDTSEQPYFFPLGDSAPSQQGMGCGGVDSSDPALNADNFFDFDDQEYGNLIGVRTPWFVYGRNKVIEHNGCGFGAPLYFSDVQFPEGSAFCRLDMVDSALDWIGTTSDAISGAVCVLNAKVAACNGIASDFTLTVSFGSGISGC